MANLSDQFKSIPQGKQFLENQKAIRQLLADPETKKLLSALQQQNASQLQAAAQAAMKGDSSALSGVLNQLSRDPEAARAIETLGKKMD